MPYTLLQAASSLQFMDTSGVLTTLTLPTGVTIDSTKVPRFTIFGRYVVVVNSPTRPITVDADGIVRVLTPNPPGAPVTLSGPAGGSLTGTFIVWQSYITFDAFGRIISESPMGPPSIATAIAAKYLKAADIVLSSDTVSATRLYRSTTGGSIPFLWIDVDGNTQTSIQDDLSDTLLGSVAAPTLGAPSRLSLIAEFRGRLWGVSLTDIDAVRYTEAELMYSWPSTNRIIIPKEGGDDRGVTAILARRESLAIGRQNKLVEIVGNDNDDFREVKLSDETGVEASDSLAVHLDTCFFLGKDGIYSWDDSGVNNVSDGKVRSWFTTDTYFNRARFPYAVGRIDPLSGKYQLLLSATGSSNLDRWIEYDIKNRTFWGPHKTDDFTPTWITTLLDSSNLPVVAHASSSGFFYKEQATRTDGTATGIAFDVDGKFHDMQTPDITKFFGELSVMSKIQAAGTLTINSYVGGLDAAAGAAISATMTLGRERLRRLGIGRFCKLNFQHSVAGQDVELFGYEIPFHEIGRR